MTKTVEYAHNFTTQIQNMHCTKLYSIIQQIDKNTQPKLDNNFYTYKKLYKPLQNLQNFTKLYTILNISTEPYKSWQIFYTTLQHSSQFYIFFQNKLYTTLQNFTNKLQTLDKTLQTFFKTIQNHTTLYNTLHNCRKLHKHMQKHVTKNHKTLQHFTHFYKSLL